MKQPRLTSSVKRS